jgi:sec-independent protein translocase protein TatC
MAEPKRAARDASGEMPFLDHLEELRWRIVRALIAIALGVGAGYAVVRNWDVVGFLAQPVEGFLPPGQKLLFTSPIYPFIITLKLSFVIGLVLATPVVLYQVWGFLRPALYKDERRVIIPVGLLSVVLFSLGAAMAFYVVLPLTLEIMKGFQSESLAAFITADQYFGLTTTLVIAFGLVFQLPLLLLLLVYMRIVTAAFLRRQRRTFIVLNAVISAIVTPGDIVIMTVVVMVPIQLFYELSIVIAMIVERRRQRAAAAEEQAAGAEGTPAPGAA